jgi:hypothetical protein
VLERKRLFLVVNDNGIHAIALPATPSRPRRSTTNTPGTMAAFS